MQYIRFYKNRLPFKPKTNVVIYFDVTGIGRKLYYHVINQYYDRIDEEFRRGGLEFCFLPKIANDMDYRKIYRYFNPQAGPNEYDPYIDLYTDRDLLEYLVADFDENRLKPGIIQYKGESFDNEETYTFAYTQLPDSFGDSPLELVKTYIKQHGISTSIFGNAYMQNEAVAEAVTPAAIDTFPSKCNLDFAPKSSSTIPVESDEPSIEEMMSDVQILVERLRQSGVGEIALQRLFKPTQRLSRMHIRYGRIFLQDYNNMEIKMHPLSKALYLLFLRHPEGIMFSNLPNYRDELLRIYGMISGRDIIDEIRRSIDDMTDPTRNSINEKCSRIKQAFLREFDDSIARNYYITGGRGEAKKILIPREMVTWMPRGS